MLLAVEKIIVLIRVLYRVVEFVINRVPAVVLVVIVPSFVNLVANPRVVTATVI